MQVVHFLQKHHSKICHNEKTQAHYAHTPFHYYDCFATIPYLEETSLTLMCNPSTLRQDSLWMVAKRNCETSPPPKKCDYQMFIMYVISDTKNSQHKIPGPYSCTQQGVR